MGERISAFQHVRYTHDSRLAVPMAAHSGDISIVNIKFLCEPEFTQAGNNTLG